MDSRNRSVELGAPTLVRLVLSLAFTVLLLFPGSSWAQESRKLIKKVDPVYPELARKMNMTGSIKVEISITADGGVHDFRLLGGNPVLAAAVEDAVKQWKYASGPAETKKGLEFKF